MRILSENVLDSAHCNMQITVRLVRHSCFASSSSALPSSEFYMIFTCRNRIMANKVFELFDVSKHPAQHTDMVSVQLQCSACLSPSCCPSSWPQHLRPSWPPQIFGPGTCRMLHRHRASVQCSLHWASFYQGPPRAQTRALYVQPEPWGAPHSLLCKTDPWSYKYFDMPLRLPAIKLQDCTRDMYRTSRSQQRPESIWSCMRRSAHAHAEDSRDGRLLTRTPAAAAHPRLPQEAVGREVHQRRAAAALQRQLDRRSAGRSASRSPKPPPFPQLSPLPPARRRRPGRATTPARSRTQEEVDLLVRSPSQANGEALRGVAALSPAMPVLSNWRPRRQAAFVADVPCPATSPERLCPFV